MFHKKRHPNILPSVSWEQHLLWLYLKYTAYLFKLHFLENRASYEKCSCVYICALILGCKSPSVYYLKIILSQRKSITSTSPNAIGFSVIRHEVYWKSAFLLHISEARFIFQRFASTWLAGCRFLLIVFEGGKKKLVAACRENERNSREGSVSVKVCAEQIVKISLPFQISSAPRPLSFNPEF